MVPETAFLLHASPFTSSPVRSVGTTRHKSTHPVQGHPPSKPDWLLILMGILFLITLLIAWLVDLPTLFR